MKKPFTTEILHDTGSFLSATTTRLSGCRCKTDFAKLSSSAPWHCFLPQDAALKIKN